MSKEKYFDRISDVAIRGESMKVAIGDSQYSGGVLIEDPKARFSAVSAAIVGSLMLASSGIAITEAEANVIAPAWANAINDYTDTHGVAPCDELLAAAHKTAENMFASGAGNSHAPSSMMLASIGANTSSSDGVVERARVVAMVLPTYLRCATNQAVTLIPAGKDVAEIFRLVSIAGSTSGELTKGDIIAEGSTAQFSQQRQRYVFPAGEQPDNIKTTFDFATATDLPSLKKHTLKPDTVFIYHNRVRVAKEVDGLLTGTLTIGGTTYALSGTVDSVNGTFQLISSAAIASGELHAQFEIDIENDPTLIPTVQQKMSVVEVKPFEVAIASQTTIQAFYKMQREHGIDTSSALVNAMSNFLAYETDTRRLRDMAFCATLTSNFNKYVADGAYYKEKYEEFAEHVTVLDAQLMDANKKSGIVGAFVGLNASAFLQALGSEHFKLVSNYKRIPQVHLVGRLFGKYDIYEVPNALDDLTSDEILWYGKGQNHGDSGYVAGTAIPPIMINHPQGSDLIKSNTLWGSEYGEVHPDNGAAYFAKTTITNVAPA